MSTEIRIKGRIDPLVVSFEAGSAIKQLFLNENIPASKKIEINDWTGTKADIKSVWLNKDDFKKTINVAENSFETYKKERSAIQALPIDERASRIGFFQIMWSCFMGTKMLDQYIILEVIELQKEFFTKNHYRIIPDIDLFKKFFEGKSGIGMHLSLIESVLRSDKNSAEIEEAYFKSFKQ